MNNIDWNQVRIDASINIMNAILSSSIMVFIFQFIFKKQIADIAVEYADKMIEISNNIITYDLIKKVGNNPNNELIEEVGDSNGEKKVKN